MSHVSLLWHQCKIAAFLSKSKQIQSKFRLSHWIGAKRARRCFFDTWNRRMSKPSAGCKKGLKKNKCRTTHIFIITWHSSFENGRSNDTRSVLLRNAERSMAWGSHFLATPRPFPLEFAVTSDLLIAWSLWKLCTICLSNRLSWWKWWKTVVRTHLHEIWHVIMWHTCVMWHTIHEPDPVSSCCSADFLYTQLLSWNGEKNLLKLYRNIFEWLKWQDHQISPRS